MIYQQMNLFGEQEEQKLQSFRGASHASRTLLQDCVKRLVMSVICGLSTGESLAKLGRNGSWLKMYEDYCQARMDGFFEEYSGIFPTWGLMLDGVAFELPMSERFTPENGLRLLPTMGASEWKGATKKRYIGSKWYHGSKCAEGLRTSENDPQYLNPNFAEVFMGFPMGWTELNASETQ